MAQIYIVICDTQKNVLVAKKNSVCSFWQGKQTSKTTIVNGGGQYAYPGGRLKHGVTPENGAYTEFYEETGISQTTVTQLISRHNVKVYKNHTGKVLYSVLFLVVSDAGLIQLAKTSHTNILFGYVTDKELNSVEIMSIQEAKDVFSDKNDPVIGWFHQPTIDIDTV